MRPLKVLLFALGFLLCQRSIAQQTTPITTQQSGALLIQSLSALAGAEPINDVTLNGNATRIAGSDNESGSVTLEALLTGQSLMKIAVAAGQYEEVISISSNGQPAGTWTGPQGTAHSMAQHNLFTDSSWFFPALTLSKLVASPTTVGTVVGQEIKDGVSVTHVKVYQHSNAPAQLAPQLQGLAQMDIYIDTVTLLPVALDFALHPDNNMLVNIPVEIQFSDYRPVSGVQIPFHIQKYFNNSLFLDIQLQTADVNSGIAAGAFIIQ